MQDLGFSAWGNGDDGKKFSQLQGVGIEQREGRESCLDSAGAVVTPFHCSDPDVFGGNSEL
jgi:hypothetical protein